MTTSKSGVVSDIDHDAETIATEVEEIDDQTGQITDVNQAVDELVDDLVRNTEMAADDD